MLRPFNLRDMRSDANEVVFLSPDFVNDIELKLFYRNDLAFARVGNVGCSIITQEKVTISPNIIACSLKPKALNPAYAALFFNTKYGRLQMEGAIKAVAQPTISTSLIRELRLPVISERIQTLLQEMLETVDKLALESCSLLMRAEQTLLAVLGLNDWQPPEPLTYVRSSKEVEAAERFDSEFYKPKFDALISRISGCGACVSLGSLLSHNQRGKQPVYAETGLPVVNSKQVLKNEVVLGDDNACAETIPSVQQIRPGDVVINGTGVGTIGRAAAYLHNIPAVPDNHVTILRIKDDAVDAVYLSVYLNSIAGQIQVNKWFHGSSGQTELYPGDIAQFQIWLAPIKVQKAIRKMVEDAFKARNDAKALLARARQAVEVAIEEDEAAGMAVLAGGAHG